MADDTEELHDPSCYLFIGAAYVIAPDPTPDDNEAIVRKLARVESSNGDTVAVDVIVFSDIEQAERFIQKAGGRGGRQKPLTFRTQDAFASVLEVLATFGDTHVAVDPYDKHVRRLPISKLISAIRNRKQ